MERKRLLVAFGMALFATSCLMNAHLSPDNSGPQFLAPNLVASPTPIFATMKLPGPDFPPGYSPCGGTSCGT